MQGLDEISFKIGQMQGTLESINRDTSSIKKDLKDINGRVMTIETKSAEEKGAQAQNKKIAGIVGSIFGFISGSAASYFFK